MEKWGSVTEEILAALQEVGPMTRKEICDHLQRNKQAIGAVVSRLSKATPQRPKRVYIQQYVYDSEGQRCYPRAVYALGDRKDATRPKRDQKAVKRRYWARQSTIMRANSVFNLGLSRTQLQAMRKAAKCSTSSESTQD
jgi:hypothetical protein